MSRISLLRHGATVAGARYCGSSDVLLSDEGWRQLRKAVAAKRWTRIVSSPLQRCSAFAQVVAHEHAITCEIDVRWRELHFGAWEGRSAAEIFDATPQALEDFWRDPLAHPPPDAETLSALQLRVLAAWHALIETAADEDILVVTHAGPIRIIIAEQRRLSLSRLLEIEVHHAQIVDLEMNPACVLS